jgi:uncharacterized repeat protein (TIGR03806 family)
MRGQMWTIALAAGLACGDGGSGQPSGGESGGSSGGDACAGTTRCPVAGALPLAKLSDYDFFQQPMRELKPKDGVVPYTVAAPLWSDAAGKGRYIVLPEGGKIGFVDGEGYTFPEGTIIIKTFFFDHDRRDPAAGARVIETRLLIREGGLWKPTTYLWDEAEEEATLTKVGKRVDVAFVDVDGTAKTEEYIVPNLDQCASCHERNDKDEVLGIITQQLNMDIVVDGQTVNQLTWLESQGIFAAPLPETSSLPRFAAPFGGETLDARARAYLHANCSHCHRDGGGAGKSGLVFLAWEQDMAKLGVCKVPAAAGPGTGGHPYDIVPGKPDESIVIFRMNSLDPEIKMPELPNRVIDAQGVSLIRDWIAAMPPVDACGSP